MDHGTMIVALAGRRLKACAMLDWATMYPSKGVRVASRCAFKSVLWDFNGTLIDDLSQVLRSVNPQLAKRGLPTLTEAAYRDVFGFPVEEYYVRIGLDVQTESMSRLSQEFFDNYAPGLWDCPLHDGVLDVLERLNALSMRQFVLSAMEETLLRSMVEHLGIAPYFEGVFGLAHLEGDSKVSRGQQLLEAYAIEPSTTLLIGDTDHDAHVADVLGLTAALIAKGHQSLERLRRTGHPVYESYPALEADLFPNASGPV
jgi:phosphoglycolate phosphatase